MNKKYGFIEFIKTMNPYRRMSASVHGSMKFLFSHLTKIRHMQIYHADSDAFPFADNELCIKVGELI